jgi:MYXO-CTERM domain-containing protein
VLLLLAGACGEGAGGPGPGPGTPHGGLVQAIRPTDGMGWNGNGYDTTNVKSHDSPGGHFRVFYALDGASAVDLRDLDPPDGVPDFVDVVAQSADATWQSTVDDRGFRPPLDDSVYHDRPDYGGDARFDIYLRAVGRGSDGYRVDEVCTSVPFTCAGYFVMAPSFRGSSYMSDREAAEVLTSHELFHNVQSAYDARQWSTWSEGTAVWNQTQVFPEGGLRDFLGFLPYFLEEPERPFDKSMGTGPGGLYAYGSVLWPQYLSERFGADIIREIWEGSAATMPNRSPHFLDVTDKVLGSKGTTLAAAWREFTVWNLLTAGRAQGGRGYRQAGRYPGVRLEQKVRGLGETTVQLDGMSARYLQIDPGLDAPRRLRLLLVDESDTPATGTAFVAAADGKPGEERAFPSGKLDLDVAPRDTIFVVVSGVIRGAAAHPVTIRLADAPAPPAPPDMEGSGCAIAGGRGPAGTSGAAGALLGLALLILRRRRH